MENKELYRDQQSLLDGLFAFLDKSVSPFHSAAAACEILEKEGYTLCPEGQAWQLNEGGRYYTTRNGTAVLAWRMPQGKLDVLDLENWRMTRHAFRDGVLHSSAAPLNNVLDYSGH